MCCAQGFWYLTDTLYLFYDYDLAPGRSFVINAAYFSRFSLHSKPKPQKRHPTPLIFIYLASCVDDLLSLPPYNNKFSGRRSTAVTTTRFFDYDDDDDDDDVVVLARFAVVLAAVVAINQAIIDNGSKVNSYRWFNNHTHLQPGRRDDICNWVWEKILTN